VGARLSTVATGSCKSWPALCMRTCSGWHPVPVGRPVLQHCSQVRHKVQSRGKQKNGKAAEQRKHVLKCFRAILPRLEGKAAGVASALQASQRCWLCNAEGQKWTGRVKLSLTLRAR
jgi:hypothetical protein